MTNFQAIFLLVDGYIQVLKVCHKKEEAVRAISYSQSSAFYAASSQSVRDSNMQLQGQLSFCMPSASSFRSVLQKQLNLVYSEFLTTTGNASEAELGLERLNS